MSRPHRILGLKFGNYRIPKATHRLAKITDRTSIFFGPIPVPALAAPAFDLLLSSASPKHSKVRLARMFMPIHRACLGVAIDPMCRRLSDINQRLME